MESHIADITRVIQLSVAPAFLLVAIGNLLMILNVRLGRIVDRRRALEDRLGGLSGDAAAGIEMELAHLHQRAVLIYFATLSAVLGALAVCLVVAGAFIGALLEVKMRLAGGRGGQPVRPGHAVNADLLEPAAARGLSRHPGRRSPSPVAPSNSLGKSVVHQLAASRQIGVRS